MPLSVFPQDGLNAIHCSANKDNFDKFISANFTDSEYDTTEDPILFSRKHHLITNLCLFKERKELVHQGLKNKTWLKKISN